MIAFSSFAESWADRTTLTVKGRTVLVQYNSIASAKNVKLVLAFHALASSPKDMLDETGLSEKSDQHDFILVAPEGQGEPFRSCEVWIKSPNSPTSRSRSSPFPRILGFA